MFQPYHLSRGTRIAIMLVLIASFFVLSPLLILYTAGYRYDTETGSVQTRGVLSIDVEPDDATVYINDVRIEENLPLTTRLVRLFQGKSLREKAILPLRLPDLTPGVYHVHIEKEGYQPWTKDITIESNKTAYIKNISLFKQATPTHLFDTNAAIFFSPSGEYMVRVDQGTAVLTTIESPDEILFSTKQEEKPTRILWSPYRDQLAIETEREKKPFLSLISPKAPENPVQYELEAPVEHFQWADSDVISIIIQQKKKLEQLTLVNRTLIETVSSSVWYVEKNGTLWQKDKTTHTLVSTHNKNAIPLETSISEIIEIHSESVLARDENTLIRITKQGDDTVRIPTPTTFFNTKTNEWIAWSPWELWLLGQGRLPELRHRTSDAIRFVRPLDTEGVLLIATDKGLHAFNPNPLYYTTHALYTESLVETATVNIEKRMLYVVTEKDGVRGVYEIEY